MTSALPAESDRSESDQPRDRPASVDWFPALWLAAAGAFSLLGTIKAFSDRDVYEHLALGRHIESQGIPSVEPFSFLTPAHAWVPSAWAHELLLARLVDVGGRGLACAVFGIIATGALVLAALAVPGRRRSPGPIVAVSLLLGTAVAAPVAGVRSQTLSLLGVAVVLHVLARWREGGRRAVWVLPPLLLAWCNVDSGFVLGLVIPLAALALHRPRRGGDAVHRRPLAAAITVAALLTLANPAGPGLHAYLLGTFASADINSIIPEWLTPSFHSGAPQLMLLVTLALLVVWCFSDGPELIDVVLAGGSLAASLYSQANMGLFAVVAVPQLIRYGTEAWRRLWPTGRWRWSLGPAPLVLVIVLILARLDASVLPSLSAEAQSATESTAFPEAAVDYALAHHPGERLYSRFEWGGYLAYREQGRRLVFVYGEPAILGAQNLNRYLRVRSLAPGWDSELPADHIRNAVVPPGDELAALRELGWTVECFDDRSNSTVMSLKEPRPVWTQRVTPPPCAGG